MRSGSLRSHSQAITLGVLASERARRYIARQSVTGVPSAVTLTADEGAG